MDDEVKDIRDWESGEFEGEWATKIGEKICKFFDKLFAKMLWWIIQGFSWAIGILLAWSLVQWLGTFYGHV